MYGGFEMDIRMMTLDEYIAEKNHKCRNNNWLKIHHKPMRRKPFKRNDVGIIFVNPKNICSQTKGSGT